MTRPVGGPVETGARVSGKMHERAREDAGLGRKAATLVSVVGLVALVVGSLFGDHGVLRLVEHRDEVRRLAAEVEALRAENGRLAVEIQALREDPRAVEKIAREELGLVRPGETLFLVRDYGEERPPADHP